MIRSAGPALLVILVLVAGCAAAESGATAEDVATAPAAATPSADAAATAAESAEVTAEATPSPSAEAISACDLVDASVAPEGTTASEPRSGTLEDLEAAVDEAAEGSPGRVAAEMNLEAYEAMGLVERCSVIFADAAGARFSMAGFVFEDESGSAEYLEFLNEGCQAGELPASATIDATVVACPARFPPIVYVAITEGATVQTASASSMSGTIGEGTVEQAVSLLEAAAR